jgi:hypothetical protein
MEILPLIHIQKRKILTYQQENTILDKLKDDEILYIYDLDGIERDKPNLCTFQRVSKSHQIWVDNGPRNLGDIVDVFMAGATKITVRPDLWHNISIPIIREITENQIFININLDVKTRLINEKLLFQEADGLVNFNKKEQIESNFKNSDLIRNLQIKNKIFSYEKNTKNLEYWRKLGIEGLLVEIDQFKEFKKL